MIGYRTDTEQMHALASKLRGASSDLESGAADPPPPVQAGEVTEAINGFVGAMTSSLAGIVEGIGAAGDAVISGKDAYLQAEEDAKAHMPTTPE